MRQRKDAHCFAGTAQISLAFGRVRAKMAMLWTEAEAKGVSTGNGTDHECEFTATSRTGRGTKILRNAPGFIHICELRPNDERHIGKMESWKWEGELRERRHGPSGAFCGAVSK